MNYKSKELNDVIACSESMLKDAEAGNWDNVIALEAKRSKALNELFSLPFTQQDRDQNSERIGQLLSVNSKLESITARARENIKDEVRGLSKGRRAMGAYAQHAG